MQSIVTLALPGNQRAALLRLATDEGTYGAILGLVGGKPARLWEGSLTAQGDPGEKVAQVIRATPSEVLIGPTDQQAPLCGQQALPLLAAQQLTASGMRPTSIPERPSGPPLPARLRVQREPPPGPPLLPWLAPRPSHGAHGADRLTWPTDTLDRNLATGWLQTSADARQRPFLNFGWHGGEFPIQRLWLALKGPQGLPQRIRLHTAKGTLTVALPHGTRPEGTQAVQWIELTPAEPILTGCLTMELLDCPGPVQLLEVQADSPFDGAPGLTQLQQVLSGERGPALARQLAQLGPSILPRIAPLWTALAESSQSALLPIAVRALPGATPAQLLNQTLESAALHKQLLDRVSQRPTPALLAWAASRLHQPGAHQAALAQAAAVQGPASLLRPTLSRLAASTDAEQAQYLDAVGTLCQRFPQAFLTAVTEQLAAPPGLPVVAAARLALLAPTCVNDTELQAKLLARTAMRGDEGFVERYWRIRAFATAPLDPNATDDPYTVYLATCARTDPTWILRDLALQSLQTRSPGTAATRTAALHGLKDPYPRVRAQALAVLADTPTLGPDAFLQISDDWPLVRAAAIAYLPDAPSLRNALARLAQDPVAAVREAAIARALVLRDPGSAQVILARLVAPNESLAVQRLALRYVAALCVKPALPALNALFDASLEPGATSRAQELGLHAARALAQIGEGSAPLARLAVVRNRRQRAAIAQALHTPGTCTPE